MCKAASSETWRAGLGQLGSASRAALKRGARCDSEAAKVDVREFRARVHAQYWPPGRLG